MAVQRKRLNSYLIAFPIIALIGAVIIYVGVAWKGLFLIRVFEDFTGHDVGSLELVIFSGVLSLLGTAVLVWFLSRDMLFSEYLYCGDCDAADSEESGICPKCSRSLTEKQTFFFVQFDGDQDAISEMGLHILSE